MTRCNRARDCLIPVIGTYTPNVAFAQLGSRNIRTQRDPSTTKRPKRRPSHQAYASRHRPSVWPTTRRYPTERRTATTRVPSRFPSVLNPSSFILLPVLSVRVRDHLYASASSLCYYLPAYVHTDTRLCFSSLLSLLFLPSAFKAVRVLQYTRNITRLFLDRTLRQVNDLKEDYYFEKLIFTKSFIHIFTNMAVANLNRASLQADPTRHRATNAQYGLWMVE